MKRALEPSSNRGLLNGVEPAQPQQHAEGPTAMASAAGATPSKIATRFLKPPRSVIAKKAKQNGSGSGAGAGGGGGGADQNRPPARSAASFPSAFLGFCQPGGKSTSRGGSSSGETPAGDHQPLLRSMGSDTPTGAAFPGRGAAGAAPTTAWPTSAQRKFENLSVFTPATSMDDGQDFGFPCRELSLRGPSSASQHSDSLRLPLATVAAIAAAAADPDEDGFVLFSQHDYVRGSQVAATEDTPPPELSPRGTEETQFDSISFFAPPSQAPPTGGGGSQPWGASLDLPSLRHSQNPSFNFGGGGVSQLPASQAGGVGGGAGGGPSFSTSSMAGLLIGGAAGRRQRQASVPGSNLNVEPSGGSLPQHLLMMQGGGGGGDGEGLLPAIRTGRGSGDYSLERRTTGGGAKRRQENLDWARSSQPTRGAGGAAGAVMATGGEGAAAGGRMARGMAAAAAAGGALGLDRIRRSEEEGGERMSLTPRDSTQDDDEVVCLGGQQPETATASIMRHNQEMVPADTPELLCCNGGNGGSGGGGSGGHEPPERRPASVGKKGANPAASAAAAAGAKRMFNIFLPRHQQRHVILIRHGESEYNRAAMEGKGFHDPMIFDPDLTDKGRSQARLLRSRLAEQIALHGEPLWVISPLRRTLQTFLEACPHLPSSSLLSASPRAPPLPFPFPLAAPLPPSGPSVPPSAGPFSTRPSLESVSSSTADLAATAAALRSISYPQLGGAAPAAGTRAGQGGSARGAGSFSGETAGPSALPHGGGGGPSSSSRPGSTSAAAPGGAICPAAAATAAAASLCAGHLNIEVLPTISEFLATAGDVGSPASALAKEFPMLANQLGRIPENWWFHAEGPPPQQPSSATAAAAAAGGRAGGHRSGPGGPSSSATASAASNSSLRNCATQKLIGSLEPKEHKQRRVAELGRWLASRPEKFIVLIGHCSFWYEFRGKTEKRMANGEMRCLRF